MSTDPSAVTEAPAPAPATEYWCDQCGKRYPGPGVCTNEHPPNELRPLEASAEAEGTADEEIAPGQGSEDVTVPTPVADVPADAPAAAPETPQPAAEAAPAEAAPAEPVPASVWQTFEAAYQALKTALGL